MSSLFGFGKRAQTQRRLRLETLENRSLFSADLGFQSPAEISGSEQLVIELINRARANPTAEANRLGIDLNSGLSTPISASPKQPLAPNSSLQRASELHSRDMLDNDYFSHTGKNGSSPSDRAILAGYQNGVGENLAVRSVRSPDAQRDAELAHEQLFRSAGHRSNLLIDFYRELGIGIEYGDFNFASGEFPSTITTEVFGATENRFITGVAYTDQVVNDDFYSVGEGINGVSIVATSATGARYSTITGASGGYSLSVPPGVYSLVATVPGRTTLVELGNVTIQNANVKIDIASDQLPLDTPSDRPVDAPLPTEPVFNTRDVNQDGIVTALDALRVINAIRRPVDANFSRFDVNGDGIISALDALLVINHIARERETSATNPVTSSTSSDNQTVAENSTLANSFDEEQNRNRKAKRT